MTHRPQRGTYLPTGSLLDGNPGSTLSGNQHFGDNIIAALPDVVGSTIGNMAADEIASSGDVTKYAKLGAVSPKLAGLMYIPAVRMPDIVVTGRPMSALEKLGYDLQNSRITQSIMRAGRSADQWVSRQGIYGSYSSGFGHGVYNGLTGTIGAVLHPSRIAMGFDAVIMSNPSDIASAARRGYNSFVNADANGRAFMLGNVAGGVALTAATGPLAEMTIARAGSLAGRASALAGDGVVVSRGLALEGLPLNTKVVLQGVTDRAVADLAANPGLARSLMSPGSYNHLVEGTSLAPASYGKAVERLTAEYIERDPALSAILQYQSKPFRSTPDFFGYEGYNMRPLDITTVRSTAAHSSRPYGAYTEIVTHFGLSSSLVFPR